jgi:hypothetical protein
VDSTPLAILGPLSANRINITATGAIGLASDITTGQVASGGGAVLTVQAAADGSSTFAAAANVLPLGSTRSSLTVNMPSQGGTIYFAGLGAASTDVVLNLGSGNASGQVNVGNLTVNGSGGRVDFTNSIVQGQSGSAAAVLAQSNPPNNTDYLLNGCEIGIGCSSAPPGGSRGPTVGVNQQFIILTRQAVSVSSGIGNIVSSLIEDATTAAFQSAQQNNQPGVPILNPMRDLASGPLRDRQEDPDLLLPNVSEKDY